MRSESISSTPIVRRDRNPRAKLTDKELSQAKPSAAQFKLYDGNGLHLIVTPSGSKLWRWKYSKEDGKEGLASPGFRRNSTPDCYYDYFRGAITGKELFEHPDVKDASALAKSEARQAELGTTPSSTTDGWIQKALEGVEDWALVGGPPCQAYSLAGRAP
ncbi:MAG: Arm DNA-binding domain-containing protein [Polaromonas sp.]|uniref:Arm DNA-binding domain-containing protein n=1 Tax=Polaromonas sp. TaxID=1869339 RepID=UPI00248733AC|nr:Arm DNA-binding domain-containing protein [Polaromonas sp.]MDI1239718.1 Arm DNA-binding domain-containing protein [Polaromonas sp.]